MSSFWLDNPNSLFDRSHISQIWPTNELTMNEKLNAITRLIILLTIVGYMLTKNIKIVVSFFVAIGIIIVMQRTKSNDEIKETFQNQKYLEKKPLKESIFSVPTKKNPLMNVMMDDYKYNTNKKPAAPSYNEEVKKEINERSKNPNAKLYKNLGDNLKYEHSMRNFYTMPNSQIPNDQNAFAKFCYGNMKSCKDGDEFQCTRNNLEAGRRGVS